MSSFTLVLASGEGGGWAAVAIALLGAAAVCARRCLPAARLRREQLRLHQELAARSGLDGDETAWLWQLVADSRLERPSVVFVRPTLFDDRVAAHGAVPTFAARVRGKLFGAIGVSPTPSP